MTADLRAYYAAAPLAKTYREPKAPTRIRRKATPKTERDRIAAVRAQCVARDGKCRYFSGLATSYDGWSILAALDQIASNERCDGLSEWAHMHERRRSKTRNMAPEVRHDTQHSLMLCTRHHRALDAHELRITALTRKGCDGPLKFTRQREKEAE